MTADDRPSDHQGLNYLTGAGLPLRRTCRAARGTRCRRRCSRRRRGPRWAGGAWSRSCRAGASPRSSPTMQPEFSGPLSRKILAFSIQALYEWCRKLRTPCILTATLSNFESARKRFQFGASCSAPGVGPPGHGRHCHSTGSLAASDCHSLGTYILILLPLLSFSVKMTVSPSARPAAEVVDDDLRAGEVARHPMHQHPSLRLALRTP